jgi:hypothetical protein
MTIILGILSMLGVLCVFFGFILMICGFFYAFFGSAMGNRDAVPSGIIIMITGFIIFVIPLIIEKLFS